MTPALQLSLSGETDCFGEKSVISGIEVSLLVTIDYVPPALLNRLLHKNDSVVVEEHSRTVLVLPALWRGHLLSATP